MSDEKTALLVKQGSVTIQDRGENRYVITFQRGNNQEVYLNEADGKDVIAAVTRFAAEKERGLLAESRTLVIDLSNVTGMDSGAIGSLVNANNAMKRNAEALVLAGVNKHIQEKFAITKLNRVFTTQPDVATALAETGKSIQR